MAKTTSLFPDVDAILAFWFNDGMATGWPTQNMDKLWWGGGSDRDLDIQSRFGGPVRHAVGGGLGDWELSATDRLALVILLDQFTRNVFRGRADAFAGDVRAQRLVSGSLQSGQDLELPICARAFFYMPLTHAEDMASQDEAICCFEKLLASSKPEYQEHVASFLKSAVQHRTIIARFGRFPHRNAAMGRVNSAEEKLYLRDGPRFGQ